jgi:hypothetical protein
MAGNQLPAMITHVVKLLEHGVSQVYHLHMKSKLDTDTTPRQKFTKFESGLRQFLTVSKDELAEREKRYQAERATQKKRGPKPRS